MECIGSAVLPTVARSSEFAQRGTAIHKFLHDALSESREKALAAVPEEWRDACAALDLERLPTCRPDAFAGEVSLAFDIDTGKGRELGRNLGRNYAKGPSEIVVTTDVLALTADGDGVYVGDFKSGHTRVTAAKRNPQLLAGAVAACRAYGRTRATVSVIYLREDGSPYYDQAELDALDIDAAAAELIDLGNRARDAARAFQDNGTVPRLHIGSHCKYCPALVSCPAQAAIVKRMAAEPEQVVNDLKRMLTPETAAAAYERAKAIRNVLHLFDEALYAYAEQNPILLKDGRVLGPTESTRESVDGAIARKVLTELHGPDIGDSACTFASSKAAVKRALGVIATERGEPLAPLEREVLSAIDASGGIIRTTTRAVKEHRPKGVMPALASGDA